MAVAAADAACVDEGAAVCAGAGSIVCEGVGCVASAGTGVLVCASANVPAIAAPAANAAAIGHTRRGLGFDRGASEIASARGVSRRGRGGALVAKERSELLFGLADRRE